ncbi:hypothetical protein J2Z21_001684 [Streptomyces griseochromogenes]|uniref:DUF8094 domain-containing protein n=1 Tax=Streptomyces griseochromogenes TaxID=68214 RepID=A0A1B1B7C1_9ACTN|nr:hypothetical protein [Streptomyces griseochromogenes]ANP54687.1 hypothetical protein AVL59_38395 [Streptomyces griseochromogenes]MBP2048759.1 hypothetical protein [Streptomyces griseochromogenes]
MTRERSRRRLRRRDRSALIAASLTALSLSASGCVVVHGEREVLPAATRAEAAKALTRFTDAYNKADKAYDSSLDEDYVTGALADINAARLKAGHANNPGGNPNHTPLKLTDTKFTIVKKAGWPRWFVADAKANQAGNFRWLLVFTRSDLGGPWQVAYLTLVKPGDVPRFKTDADGFAEAVPGGAAQLAVPPRELSKDYAAYLKSGGKTFADGPSTSGWRTYRNAQAKKPGLVRQYVDQPLTRGDYAPLALRTADGGAVVFFTTHHYEKRTSAPGTTVPIPNKDVKALIKGEVEQSLTLEYISNEVALDPAGSAQVSVLGQVRGLTAAQGA